MKQRADEPDRAVKKELTLLTRRHSTATVLFHHAMADRLGLGPTDHKCLDLLLQHEDMSGSRLAAITGLTTGAITGVVNRLEKAGYVRRQSDPSDGRRQRLEPVPERIAYVSKMFAEYGPDLASLLAGMDAVQISAVVTFLTRATEHLEQHATALRADAPRHNLGRRPEPDNKSAPRHDPTQTQDQKAPL
ncbi:MarR family transcriptional regulator [Arthrobacter sp. UYEF20]|uniref:MarR family winged helix-turn-helix transcriptional regulator n=1 Tax=Arthrobacter sp. UYEF20 TaxID=1756363 RepID=UPI00339429D4